MNQFERVNDPMGTRPIPDYARRGPRSELEDDQSESLIGDTRQVVSNFKDAVDKSVEGQPGATLLVAAMFGFVVGALWKA